MRPRRLLWIAKVLAYRLRYRGSFSISGFGLSVGRRVTIAIQPPGSIRIGPSVQFREGCEISALGGDIRLGPNVFFNRNCTIVAHRAVEIGSDCLFGPNVGIFDHDHGYDDPTRPIWANELRAEPISIGSDVWVGANTIVTAGARIGNRVVVGANSVVTKNLPDGGVYAGNPATLVRRIGS
jgi:acetyltransferase-like isoleucine patch superfamily enzyme